MVTATAMTAIPTDMAISTAEFLQNPLAYLNNATVRQQTVFVGSGDSSAVLISEAAFRHLEKEARNAAYLRKIDKGIEDIQAGRGIVKTIEELEAMAADEA